MLFVYICDHYTNNTMASPHHCNDKCFLMRNSDKNSINCFACNHLCALKCYGITLSQIITSLKSPKSNSVFLCNICRAMVKNMNNPNVSQLVNGSYQHCNSPLISTDDTAPSIGGGNEPKKANRRCQMI